ncbi:nucleotidyltransferase family protein [Bradyrhizobium sp.]|uniref:nucleotidyltransferase family protein n=1 Tax=Bradyrhizobium sp. TaxID=376 RepID=UPI002721642E|nr:nucleotidyltransferase family protein [Bradyrhizobium sp.]MDO9297415.1 nucleotidyltransferase family protein [Bradyrhizobium sp.]
MSAQSGPGRFHPVWPHGVWPNANQEMLIKAALLDDAGAARAAFRDWSRADDLFFVDNGLNLFLMLLYERLKHWGEAYRDHDRLRGVVRHAWVMHQRFRRDIREVGSTLGSAGIEIMLLKGAALNVNAYPDANRLMSDIDIAVPHGQLGQAIEALKRAGWNANFRNLDLLPTATHACQFFRGDSQLDLHWEFFHGRPLDPAIMADIWKSARTTALDGVHYRLLSPEFGLIHTCEHGLRYNSTPPMRWLADAFFQIRHGGAIDWRVLQALAARLGLSQHVGLTLNYLASRLQQPEAILALQSVPRWDGDFWSRAELALEIRRTPGCHQFWRELPSHIPSYLRVRRRFRGLRLSDYIRAVNNFEGPLAPILRRLTRLQLRAILEGIEARRRKLARWWRGDRTTLELSLFQETGWTGWFPPEDVPDGFLRWSEPRASFPAPISSQHGLLALTVLEVRPLDAGFLESFRVRLNRTLIAKGSIRIDGTTIIVPLPLAGRLDRREQRIELVCDPWFAPGDPRPLGIPVLGVTLKSDRP